MQPLARDPVVDDLGRIRDIHAEEVTHRAERTLERRRLRQLAQRERRLGRLGRLGLGVLGNGFHIASIDVSSREHELPRPLRRSRVTARLTRFVGIRPKGRQNNDDSGALDSRPRRGPSYTRW